MPAVIGLDLSLRAAAGCLLFPSWDPVKPTDRVRFDTWGGKCENDLKARAERVDSIVTGIVEFVDGAMQWSGEPAILIEDHAYERFDQRGVMLAELAGAVKNELFRRWGLVVRPLAQSRAQSYLLGKLPPGKGTRGPATQAALSRLGFSFSASDPGDAFVIANAGRAELGLPGVTLAG